MPSPSEPRTSRLYHARTGTAFAAHGALAVTFAAVATMLVIAIGARSAGAPLFWAVAAGQLAMLALVVAITRRVRGGASTLGLRAPPLRALVGCGLLGSSFWYVNMRIVNLLPLPPVEETTLQRLVEEPPLWGALLAVAVVPAVCEELVFRGVLARSLVPRWSPVVAIVVSAALFSGYHFSILQLLPTFLLGLVFAHVALCSDSAIPTMVAHFLNNAIALSIARGELPGVARVLGDHPIASLVGTVVVSVVGIGVATLRPVRPLRAELS